MAMIVSAPTMKRPVTTECARVKLSIRNLRILAFGRRHLTIIERPRRPPAAKPAFLVDRTAMVLINAKLGDPDAVIKAPSPLSDIAVLVFEAVAAACPIRTVVESTVLTRTHRAAAIEALSS